MEPITMYSTAWCPDCRRAKTFLKERGVAFEEVNIEEDAEGE
jgi:glutaredoxin 3